MYQTTSTTTPRHLALQQEEAKGPLIIRTVETVPPKAGQIQVRVRAAGLNPIDYKQFHYAYVTKDFPYVGGGDLGGEVLEVGEGVDYVKVGDRIAMVTINFIEGVRAGTFQEVVTSNANGAVKLPDSVSFIEGATFPVTYFTAYTGLFYILKLNPPTTPTPSSEPILIWGAGSGIGQHAIQQLHNAGYTNILAVASPNRFEWLQSLGAAATFDYHQKDIVQQIQAYVKEKNAGPVKNVLDAISTPDSLTPLAELLKDTEGASVATVTPQGQDILPKEVRRGRTQVAIVIGTPEEREFSRKAAQYLEAVLSSGTYKVAPFQVLEGGLAGGGVQKGADMLRENKNHGDKLVISLD